MRSPVGLCRDLLSLEALQELWSCAGAPQKLWGCGAVQELYRSCGAVEFQRVLQELYRSPTGALQELCRSSTGVLQELYKALQRALLRAVELYRSCAWFYRSSTKGSTGAPQEL